MRKCGHNERGALRQRGGSSERWVTAELSHTGLTEMGCALLWEVLLLTQMTSTSLLKTIG